MRIGKTAAIIKYLKNHPDGPQKIWINTSGHGCGLRDLFFEAGIQVNEFHPAQKGIGDIFKKKRKK